MLCFDVTVNGVKLCRDAGHEFLSWPSRKLKVGDEVAIRIVEAMSADDPQTRTAITESKLLESRRELYEKLKRHFEGA